MKQSYSYIASLLCCLLLLAACHPDESLPVQPEAKQTPMVFDVEELQTRAGIDSAKQILSLGVFGYSTGTTEYKAAELIHTPNLLYNRKVTRGIVGNPLPTDDYELTPWSYSPVAYWPIEKAIRNTFFAYAPHSSEFPEEANLVISDSTKVGYPKLTYTVPELVSEQIDLLYSFPVSNINRESAGGNVNYRMKHALSWLLFVVAPEQRNPEAGWLDMYHITSLRFVCGNLITRAELELDSGTWINPIVSPADYQFNIGNIDLPAGKISLISQADNRLMIIPQPLTQAYNPSSIDVSFTVKGVKKEGAHPTDPDQDGDPSDTNNEYFYSIPFPDTRLGAGGLVIYMLRLSGNGVTVEFYGENTIEEWLEGEEKTVDVF